MRGICDFLLLVPVVTARISRNVSVAEKDPLGRRLNRSVEVCWASQRRADLEPTSISTTYVFVWASNSKLARSYSNFTICADPQIRKKAP